MKFDELMNLVMDIRDDPARCEVHFGCDCGCGGDLYTIQEWDTMCDAANEAKRALVKLGIIFPEDEDENTF